MPGLCGIIFQGKFTEYPTTNLAMSHYVML